MPSPEPVFRFSSARGIGGHTYAGLTIYGVVGRIYQIDYSRIWHADELDRAHEHRPARHPFLFTDSTSTNCTKRFYRASRPKTECDCLRVGRGS